MKTHSIHQVDRHGAHRWALRGAVLSLAATVVAAALFTSAPPDTAQAATVEVTSGANEGPGTLRDAIESIDPNDADPIISIAAGLTITLEGSIEIPDVLTVRGADGERPIITFDPEIVKHPSLFAHKGERLSFVAEHLAVHGSGESGSDVGLWGEILATGSEGETAIALRDLDVSRVTSPFNVSSAPDAQILIENSAFADIGLYRNGEGSLVALAHEFTGSFTVLDSSFESMWLMLTSASLTTGTVRVERSHFTGPGLSSRESAAGAMEVQLLGGATAGTVPVTIKDSTLSGIGADDAGALLFEARHASIGVPVLAEITGSTFTNTTTHGSGANAISMNIDDPATSIVVSNSTFLLPTIEPEEERNGIVTQRDSNSARVVMDHVTSVGVGISAQRAARATIRDSAFLTEPTGVLMHPSDAGVIAEGHNDLEDFRELDVSDVLIERSVISTPGIRFPDVTGTPEGEFLLGALTSNGGSTHTMVPGPGSKLIDAAGGSLSSDQRGLPRPVGTAPDAGAVEVHASAVALQQDVTAPEGQPLEFTVTRTGGESSHPATVQFSTHDGSARAGTNYDSASGAITWAAGDTEPKRITITSQQDGVITDPLKFMVRLTHPGDRVTVTADAAERTGTITNIDEEVVIPPGPDPEPDPDPETPPAVPPTQPATPPGEILAESGSGAPPWAAALVLAALGAAIVTLIQRRRRTEEE